MILTVSLCLCIINSAMALSRPSVPQVEFRDKGKMNATTMSASAMSAMAQASLKRLMVRNNMTSKPVPWAVTDTQMILQQLCLEQPYNMLVGDTGMAFSIGISYPNGDAINVHCGLSFVGITKPPEFQSDKSVFAMGSTTKMVTAAAILKLVDQGKLNLDDKMIDKMGDVWKHLVKKMGKKDATGNSSYYNIEDLLGPNIKKVTIAEMIGMSSGIPDFDNDVSRKFQLQHPDVNLGPIEEIDFIQASGPAPIAWDCKPGKCTCYSSTNYEFAGLVLLQQSGKKDWKDYDQMAAIPKSIREHMKHTSFPVKNTCRDIPNMVNGFTPELSRPVQMIPSWEGGNASSDMPFAELFGNPNPLMMSVYDVSCTNGWSCGNVVSNGHDMAIFVRKYLTTNEYIPASLRKKALTLTPFSMTCSWMPGQLPYGFGLMDLSDSVGEFTTKSACVGHAGDTYGFNANTCASLKYNFGISVTGNTENGLPVDILTMQTYWVAMMSVGAVDIDYANTRMKGADEFWKAGGHAGKLQHNGRFRR